MNIFCVMKCKTFAESSCLYSRQLQPTNEYLNTLHTVLKPEILFK